MKKLLAFFLIAASIATLHSLNIFAADNPPLENFTITHGIDPNKPYEITFDKSRSITGAAPKDTSVFITVYDVTDPEDKKVDSRYNVMVGSSGMFSQDINFVEGRNYVVVAAVNGDKRSEVSATISRKKYEIKNVLSQYIALPGQSK